MSKKTIKILSVVFTIAVVLMTFAVPAFSYSPNNFSGETNNINGLDTLTNAGNKIIGIIQVVGMIVSVIILMVLGIKYMMGSAEEKASYKKTMIPYVVGAILLFAASAIAEMVYNAVGTIGK